MQTGNTSTIDQDEFFELVRDGKTAFWKGFGSMEGTIAPYIAGGSGDEDDLDDDEDDDDDEEDDAEEETFTQADVNRIASREKKQARRGLLKDLGVDTLEDLKAIVQKHKDSQDETLSETDKARKQAEADREAAAKDRKELAQEKQMTKVERALIRAGIDDGKLTRALRGVDLPSDPEDFDEDFIKDLVKDLKADEPGWFDTEDEEDDEGKLRKERQERRQPRPRRAQGAKKKSTGGKRQSDEQFEQRFGQRRNAEQQ